MDRAPKGASAAKSFRTTACCPTGEVYCNHELRQPGSLHSYLIATNLHLNNVSPPFVTIHDVESMANMHGKRH